MKKRIVSFIISILMVFNISILYPKVALADASTYAYQNALIPIEAFATAIAIGSGIVASNSQAAVDSASEMLRKAVASMKAKACLDSETEFRVIDGGKPRKPQKGDDKNNRKWFTIAAGSVATGSLIAGLKASREMMNEIYEQNGYEKINKITNQVSINDVSKFMSFSYIKNQIIESHLPGAITQINNIESELMSIEGFNLNDYLYSCSYFQPSLNNYPKIVLICVLKEGIEYYQPYSFSIVNNSFRYNDINYKGFYLRPSYIGKYINNDLLTISSNGYKITAMPYSTSGGTKKIYNEDYSSTTYDYESDSAYGLFQYFGFVGGTIVNYDFTNQIYNNSETQQVNFPDWLQQSIETLNGNLAGLNLAINNLQLPQTWNDIQTNIQTGKAPANVINQYINNWSNPEQAPDPEPDPEPNPDPEPDPNPQPTPEPAPTDDYLQGFILPTTITEKFPFCVPFDIAKCLKLFSVSGREAPKWEGTIKYGVKGEHEYKVTIDLKDFEPIAKIVRPLEFIVFLVGLIIITRDLIKG